jgi:hypothetical protein
MREQNLRLLLVDERLYYLEYPLYQLIQTEVGHHLQVLWRVEAGKLTLLELRQDGDDAL